MNNELLARVAAIVCALDETNGSPESMLYIFCNMDMESYQIVRDVLVKAGLVNIKGNYVTLTENGKTTAQKLNDAIKKGN